MQQISNAIKKNMTNNNLLTAEMAFALNVASNALS